MIYRYKSNAADAKFDEFDNHFGLLDKIRHSKISLTDAKNDQPKFKSKWNKKGGKKGNKKHCMILKCFTKQGTVLLNFLMISLQWYQKIKT